ncbi:MAG: phosphoserine phosphatase SerB [Pseudomonadota bacterium]
MSEPLSSEAIVTLVADPYSRQLSADLVEEVAKGLGDAGFPTASRRALREGVAEDIMLGVGFDPAAKAAILAAARSALGAAPIDVVIQPSGGRRKNLLIADMDSTIIGQECLDELAGYAGLKDEIAAVTERAMRGELNFEEALRARVARLKGLTADALQRTFDEKVTLTPGAETLVKTMRANGAMTILASGGFTFFTERVAVAAGFERNVANILEISDGVLKGTVREPIFGREGKAETLAATLAELELAPAEAIAVGDGANDLAMIDAAGLGVAFRAKPAVADAADVGVTHGDLTALLHLQGYADEEFVR